MQVATITICPCTIEQVHAGQTVYVDQSDRARRARARTFLARVRNWYLYQPWAYRKEHDCPPDPWRGWRSA